MSWMGLERCNVCRFLGDQTASVYKTVYLMKGKTQSHSDFSKYLYFCHKMLFHPKLTQLQPTFLL